MRMGTLFTEYAVEIIFDGCGTAYAYCSCGDFVTICGAEEARTLAERHLEGHGG